MLPEVSEELDRWPYLACNCSAWMEYAKRVAVAGYRQVLEDGPGVCDSESEAEYSDHGEELTEMYTLEMPGPDGKPMMSLARLTTERANALRPKGRADGPATVAGKG
jgi:hypothetical protein